MKSFFASVRPCDNASTTCTSARLVHGHKKGVQWLSFASRVEEAESLHQDASANIPVTLWSTWTVDRYTLLVADPDMSVVRDPFAFHDARFDIEGLSDWNDQADAPRPQQLLDEGCPIYRCPSVSDDSNERCIRRGHTCCRSRFQWFQVKIDDHDEASSSKLIQNTAQGTR